ncbi:sensor histidine kinase [Rudanella lutea]|uniref:sensor histidine kinase n=1 Tax=Rudanella lutea TaxID=451374 RepID=UPI00037BFCB9|nr:two-component regulator propeller domain-containing protein [Rudanella lutea]
MKTAWLVGLLCGIGFLESRAQLPFRVERVGQEQGLVQGTVSAMCKDSRGFIWVGTQDGICRYNGGQFRAYRPSAIDSTAPVGLFVNQIIEAPTGDLWIGTDEGLNQYQRATDRFTPFQLTDSRGRRMSNPTTPFRATAHTVWYWSGQEGIVRYNIRERKKQVLFNQFSFAFNYYVTQNATTFDRRGRLWIHADEGIIAYDTTTRRATHYFSRHAQNRLGPPLVFFDFHLARNGLIYLVYADGIVCFDPDRQQFELFTSWQGKPMGQVFDLAEDPTGQLYLATLDHHVLRFNPVARTFTAVQYRPADQTQLGDVYYLYHFGDGIIWLNEDPQGLVKLNPYGAQFGLVNGQTHPKLANLNIRSFAETPDGTLWVGTLGGGLQAYDRQADRLDKPFGHDPANPQSLPGDQIRHLLTDASGTLWIATDQGLARYRGRGQFQTYRPPGATLNSGRVFVRHLAEVDNRWLLVGTEDGLYLFDRATEQFAEQSFFRHKIIGFAAPDRHGRIWVGVNEEGIYVGKLHNRQWKRRAKLLNEPVAASFYADAQNEWVSTSKGLFRFDSQLRLRQHFDEGNGLPNAFVYGVLPGQAGELWLSTNRGLCRLAVESGRVRTYGPSDGLQGNEFNGNSFFRARNGELFFGGTLGFNHFFPAQIRPNQYRPMVQLTNLTVAEKPYDLPTYIGEIRRLTLPPPDNTFALTYAALDYFSAGANRYQYRLLGLDSAWVQAGTQTVARFIKLPPGSYVFEVRAANNDGLWGPIRRLRIQLEAPFYLTFWFRLLLLTTLMAGLYGFYRYRLFAVRQQQRRDLQTAVQTQESERTHFARELHDGVGANLAALKLYLSHVGSPHVPQPDLKTRSLALLETSITDLRRLINQFSPQSLQVLGLPSALAQAAETVASVSGLQVNLHVDPQLPPLDPAFQINLYRIVQELFQNALKHAGASELTLALTVGPDGLTLHYGDNGRGFDPQVVRPNSQGLTNIRHRVELLEGEWTIRSAPGEGVQIRIRVPLPAQNT